MYLDIEPIIYALHDFTILISCVLYTTFLFKLGQELQVHLAYEIQFIYNLFHTALQNRKLTFLAE